MTRNDSFSDQLPLDEAISRAIATYGAFPVLLRAVRASLRRDRPPPLTETDDLGAHIRRDIGLAPVEPRIPPQVYLRW